MVGRRFRVGGRLQPAREHGRGVDRAGSSPECARAGDVTRSSRLMCEHVDNSLAVYLQRHVVAWET